LIIGMSMADEVRLRSRPNERAAREAEADESKEGADRAFKKIVPQKRPKRE
jgi:hypothetical protein